MTADGMLRKLGYTQKCEVMVGPRYDSEDGHKTIILDCGPDEVMKGVFPHGFGQPLTFDEVRAVAKLLDEMEKPSGWMPFTEDHSNDL